MGCDDVYKIKMNLNYNNNACSSSVSRCSSVIVAAAAAAADVAVPITIRVTMVSPVQCIQLQDRRTNEIKNVKKCQQLLLDSVVQNQWHRGALFSSKKLMIFFSRCPQNTG